MRFSLYGLPQFAISTTEVFLRLHLLIFLTTIVKIPGLNAGIIVSGSLVISAFFDPLIGSFSDKLKAKRGRITPFILFALVCLCGFLFLTFIPNWQPDDQVALFIIALGYQISYSAFIIPYLSLAKELINQEKDIVSLYAWRYFFGSIGAIVGVSLPFLQNAVSDNSYRPMGYAMIALILCLAPGALALLKEKKKTYEAKANQSQLLPRLSNLLKNPVFFGYYSTYTILSVGLGINQTLAIYYYKFGLGLTEDETNILLAVYMLVFCLSIPFWVQFANKKGKKLSLSIGLVVMCLCTLAYPFLPARNFYLLYALIVFAGLFTGIVALIDSYLSNIIDFHTLKQSEKQSNLIFGVWRISDKLSRALGIYVAGLILNYTLESQAPIFSIKDAFGYGVFIFLFSATMIFLLQKYSDHHHEKVIRILKKKNPDLLYTAEELEN